MKSSNSRLVLADTGFWIALYDRRDQNHDVAVSMMDSITGGSFLFPWPLYYEILRTRFVRQRDWMERFLSARRATSLHVIDDRNYRDVALAALSSPQRRSYGTSLVDMVIRLVLADPKLRIAALITFNARDFYEICVRRGVEIRPGFVS